MHCSPGFYSRLFLAPKRDGGIRPTIDLSLLNQYLEPVMSKIETTSSITAVFYQGEWTMLTDLKDTYFHIPAYSTGIQEIPPVYSEWQSLSVCGLALRASHSAFCLHQGHGVIAAI